jgi:hypothetical protein
MSPRAAIATISCAAAVLVPAGSALSAQGPSVGSAEQIAWVRRAAGNFVAAELSGNGASACTILNAPLRLTVDHRTCTQRWNARLARLLRERGAHARLRAEQHAIPSAQVLVHGDIAAIELPAPLMAGPGNRFRWTENCWMLEG